MKSIQELRDALHALHSVALGKSDRAYMSIPARPEHDADLILADAIDELERLRHVAGVAQAVHREVVQRGWNRDALSFMGHVDQLRNALDYASAPRTAPRAFVPHVGESIVSLQREVARLKEVLASIETVAKAR